MALNISNTSFSTGVKIDERATNSCFDMRRCHGLAEGSITISHYHGATGGTPSQEQSTIDLSSFVELPHRNECYQIVVKTEPLFLMPTANVCYVTCTSFSFTGFFTRSHFTFLYPVVGPATWPNSVSCYPGRYLRASLPLICLIRQTDLILSSHPGSLLVSRHSESSISCLGMPHNTKFPSHLHLHTNTSHLESRTRVIATLYSLASCKLRRHTLLFEAALSFLAFKRQA